MKTDIQDFTPDYKKWFAKERWTESEAACLLMGVDPNYAFKSEKALDKVKDALPFHFGKIGQQITDTLAWLTGNWTLVKNPDPYLKADITDRVDIDKVMSNCRIIAQEAEPIPYKFQSTVQWKKENYLLILAK